MPMATKYGKVLTYCVRGSHLQSHMNVWPRDLARSCDKLKHLQYRKAYCRQTWQDSDLSWWASIHKVIWSLITRKSYDKSNTFYLHYHKAYSQKTLQGGYIQKGAFTHKVRWSFDATIEFILSTERFSNSLL